MGEEVDAVLMKKVKQTQDILGPFVRKPPLTEKHLMKPPFRFIHDIITNVMENTGFFQGLYEGPELDPSSISTRETKTEWMSKLVECLKLATDQDVHVKVSKILAGQEPGKTNELLICLGNALAKGISSDKAVAIVTGKDPNPAASKSTKVVGEPVKKKKEVSKIKEASPYGQSLQKKPAKAPPKGKPSDGEKARRVSKPTEVPGASKTPGRQNKAGLSTSPPKAPSKAPQTRQPSSDGKTKRKGISPARSSTSLRGDRKDGRRLSNQLSIEEAAGPPSFNDPDGDIMDETAAAGSSRRGSLTSATIEPRGSSTYRQPTGSHRGSLSPGPSGDIIGSESGIGTFTSPEAHLDDAEQAEFMGELEFLLNKQYEGAGRVESDGDHDDDDDNNNGGGAGNGGEMIEKTTEKGDNDNFPGSSTAKESAAGKISQTPIDVAVEPDDVDHNNDDDEKILSSSACPTARKQSAAVPSSSRVKPSSPSSIEPQHPSPSPSAPSVSNAVLGTLSPSSPVPPSGKPTPEPVDTLTTRPPTARPHTSQMRPGGSNTTVSILRPPSARPAPPRPKTALFQDKEEAAFRPTTAKVHNVLLDEDEPDDENYIVHEVVAAPEQPPGELQLNKTGDLGIRGNIMEENIDLILDPEQRGLLVNQMLDAQSRLEDGSRLVGKKTEIEREGVMGEKDRLRWREDAAAEVEKLKNLMQLMARNANPLGKLMDFVQEDVDAMQRDLNKWKEESRKLDQALEAAQEETEQSMEPLRWRMAELDEAIQDRLDAIAATKMTILRQGERIRKVLIGLDKVKARSGNEPKLTSAHVTNLIEPDQESYDFGGNKVYFKKSSPSNPSTPSSVNLVYGVG